MRLSMDNREGTTTRVANAYHVLFSPYTTEANDTASTRQHPLEPDTWGETRVRNGTEAVLYGVWAK